MAQTPEQKAKIQAMLEKLRNKGSLTQQAASQASEQIKKNEVDLSNIVGSADITTNEAAAETVEAVLEAAYSAPKPLIRPPQIVAPRAMPEASPSSLQPAVQPPQQPLILQRKIAGVARTDIQLNAKQQEAADRIAAGESVVILGRAGTGKTTSMRQSIQGLISSGRIPPISSPTKWLQVGLPGVVVVSFTNKATNNIRHAMPDDVKAHTLTIHKLLEFAPVYYEDEAGKKTMRFEPSRNAYNPLPSSLRAVAFEESSMIGTTLYQMLQSALPHQHQEIMLGDIRQLPPVFDAAILGFKMLELPVIELTEVYRQALLSPILRCALTLDDGKIHEFEPGKPTMDKDTGRKTWPGLAKWNEVSEHGTLIIQPWQQEVTAERAINNMALFFKMSWEKGTYDPMNDIILCPHGAAFGKTGNYLVSAANINQKIADFLGRARGAEVHEIVAGFNRHYLAEGDRVLYDKEDAVITKITKNGAYFGRPPSPSSTKMDRWGNMSDAAPSTQAATIFDAMEGESIEDVDNLLDSYGSVNEEDRVNQASHIVEVYIPTLDVKATLTSASEINNLLFGYALTVHKSQGSEYDRVFCVFHHLHKTQLSRELIYTAFTRAKKYLHVFVHPDGLARGCKNQAIKGNTLEEKALFFKGKQEGQDHNKELFEMQQAKIAQNKLAVQTAVDVALDKLRQAYPDGRFDLNIKVLFMDIGNAAAVAVITNTENVFIKVSPTYLSHDIDDMLLATIPHEVAHLYANRWYGHKEHGIEWRQLDAAAGGNGEVFHNHGTAAQVRTQLVKKGAR